MLRRCGWEFARSHWMDIGKEPSMNWNSSTALSQRARFSRSMTLEELENVVSRELVLSPFLRRRKSWARVVDR